MDTNADGPKTLRRGYNDRADFQRKLLTAHFMPVYMLKDGIKTLDGFEALARYKPNLDCFPAAFAAELEATGVISELDLAIYEEACIFARNSSGLYVNVNFSSQTLSSATLIDKIKECRSFHGAENADIGIEIVEEPFAPETHDIILENLKTLHNMGHKLWIDDFGTGDSNNERLAWLEDHGVKIYGIKIDQSYISNHSMRALLENTPHLRDYHLVAEGIESGAHAALVHEHLTQSSLQGFIFEPPLTKYGALALLTSISSHSQPN